MTLKVSLDHMQVETTALHVSTLSRKSLAVEILVHSGADVNCTKFALQVSLLYCDNSAV